MTKPLQGALFRKFRNLIMGVVPVTDPIHIKHDPKTRNNSSLAPTTKKDRRHRSVLDRTANPAKLSDDRARIPTKKSLKERKRITLSKSHKNRQLDHATWKPARESIETTPRTKGKKMT